MNQTKSLLPVPFDWCEIPSGTVLIEAGGFLEEDTSFNVPKFFIAKYPVTNAQFSLFVKDGAYDNSNWWTFTGWQAKEEGWDEEDGYTPSGKIWKEPRYWKTEHFIGDDKPVVGISWYEAQAFCNWLSAKTGENIRLPTEQEWQRAGQASLDGKDTQLKYVWGNEWQLSYCNSNVAPETSKGLTSVTAYENKGNASLCGVIDMIGNAAEWCLTDYNTGSQEKEGIRDRVHRGGSWKESCAERCGLSERAFFLPNIAQINIGFRIVFEQSTL